MEEKKTGTNTVDCIIAFMAFTVVFCIIFISLSFMWVGAETLIVGAPNYDVVDRFVAAFMSFWLVYNRLIKNKKRIKTK